MLPKYLFHLLLCTSFSNALPTDPSSLQKRCPNKWCPSVRKQVYYPTDFSQNNCPSLINSNNNPLQGHFDKGEAKDANDELKRSLEQRNLEKRARPDNPICNQIAANDAVSNFPNFIANTGTITLVAGVTYVFSWAFDTAVTTIWVWAGPDGGHLEVVEVQHVAANHPDGTWEFTMPGEHGQELTAHFEIWFQNPGGWGAEDDDNANISGQFALFTLLAEAPNDLTELVRGLIG